MTVVETRSFLKDSELILSDAERADLVTFVGANPEAGQVIPKTGGVRKLRWALQGKGKRGGARVIFTTTVFGYQFSCWRHMRRTKRQTSHKRREMQ